MNIQHKERREALGRDLRLAITRAERATTDEINQVSGLVGRSTDVVNALLPREADKLTNRDLAIRIKYLAAGLTALAAVYPEGPLYPELYRLYSGGVPHLTFHPATSDASAVEANPENAFGATLNSMAGKTLAGAPQYEEDDDGGRLAVRFKFTDGSEVLLGTDSDGLDLFAEQVKGGEAAS